MCGSKSQDQHSFSTDRQVFAANGYAVLAQLTYRGSAGRGQKFLPLDSLRDWGNYEVQDSGLPESTITWLDGRCRSVTDWALVGWSYGAHTD
jgi:dipeptidyl aminopeptidase/acylaminoacyl peptidase